MPAKVSIAVKPPSRSPRSVDPPSSCSLNSMKPGRSKKNGSSRVPANDRSAVLDVRGAHGVLVRRGAARRRRPCPFHTLLLAERAGVPADHVGLGLGAVAVRRRRREPDAIGEVGLAVLVAVDLELVQRVRSERRGLAVGRGHEPVHVQDERRVSRARPEGVDVGDVDAVVGLGRRGVEMVGGAGEERRGSHDQGHPRDGRDAGPRGDGRDGRTHRVRYLLCRTDWAPAAGGVCAPPGRSDQSPTLGAWLRAARRDAGVFITLEGPDGSGKSSLLPVAGRGPARAPAATSSPRASPARRRSASRSGGSSWTPSRRSTGPGRADALLFAASRAQHVEEVIRPGPRAGRGRRVRPLRRLVARLPGRGLRGADGRARGPCSGSRRAASCRT